MSSRLSERIVLAVDRLDGRRHTFGLLLTALVERLAAQLENFMLLRRRARADLITARAPELILPSWLENHYAYAAFVALFLKRRGIDLIHYPFLYVPYTWWATGIKRVVTIHGAARAALPHGLVERFHPLKLERYRRALPTFDAIITVSQASKRDLIAHYRVPPEKIHVVYNGVSEAFRPDLDWQPTLARYGISRPYILSVSTIKPKKNVLATVKAYAEVKRRGLPHKLVLVGYKAPGYTAVDEAIEQLGLGHDVIQTGFVPAESVPCFYAGADLLVFPSLHEGFGLPVVEAFACGCPVVTSGVYALPEVAGDAALYCNPHDVADIGAKMIEVLTNDRLRERLIQKGLARARQFTLERYAEQTIAVYEQVLEH
ncbi:MAG: glycosyltransferase family 1 protein [Acidobacteria bacterium]|nr:MAG: glycosyltransferase family 1 protein [Acidobacteriota bacterium]